MIKKNNRNLLVLLVAVRLFDLFSTYVAGGGELGGETNFLVADFNLGWSALIISNAVFVIIFLLLLIRQSDKNYYLAEKNINPKSGFTSYFGVLYYGKELTLVEFLSSFKINYNIFFNSLIHVITLTVIVCSIIIGLSNIASGFNYANLFSISNKWYQDNIITALNMIVFIIVVILYHYRRYNNFKIKTEKLCIPIQKA